MEVALLGLQDTNKQWKRAQPKKPHFCEQGERIKLMNCQKHVLAVSMSFQSIENVFSLAGYYL